MGQKIHPYGLRLGYTKPWKSRWYSEREAGKLVREDMNVRKYLKEKLGHAGIANIEIERSSNRVRVRIFSARPGVIIGRRGQEIDKVRDDLSSIAGKEVMIDIKEIKDPQLDAQLVAENVAMQLEKRIGFRRAMKKSIQLAMQKGAQGIKIQCKGRLGGADIARHERYHEGKIPLSTFRANVDYGFAEARTTYGAIGCKVWIYKGDIYVKKEMAEKRSELEKQQKELEEKLLKQAQAKMKNRKGKEESGAAEAPAVAVEEAAKEVPQVDAPQQEQNDSEKTES